MSIKIHHGAPGSYKTSGAVMDDFVPAVLAGRHIITNVRGLSDREKIMGVIEKNHRKIPDEFYNFELTFLDTTEKEVMEQLRRFFHWAPSGCFFLLDEIQEIYPKSITEAKLSQFDFPDGMDAATEAYTFETLALAFEKHRHKNWDFVVTTPNINKVHKVVRDSAEGAYKHRNLATMGKLFSGSYVEAFHMAESNGKPSDFFTVQRKRIKKYVFDLYESTATGQVSDTLAGNSIFKDPKLLSLLVALGLVIVFVLNMGSPEIVAAQDENYKQDKLGIPAAPESDLVVNQAGTGDPADFVGGIPKGAGNGSANVGNVVADPLAGFPVIVSNLLRSDTTTIVGTFLFNRVPQFTLRFVNQNGYSEFNKKDLESHGFKVTYYNACMVQLDYEQVSKVINCPMKRAPDWEAPPSILEGDLTPRQFAGN